MDPSAKRGAEQITETIKVRIHTKGHCIEGLISVPLMGRNDRRLSNFLNSDKQFLAMTQAKIVSEVSQSFFSFLLVNMTSIEMLIPLQDAKDTIG
jgi:hypothetical protein